jgi:hypothetical protein
MPKKRGKYTHEPTKMHVKAKGKTFKLTVFLPEEAVLQIYPQLKRFYEQSKRRAAQK